MYKVLPSFLTWQHFIGIYAPKTTNLGWTKSVGRAFDGQRWRSWIQFSDQTNIEDPKTTEK